MKTSKGAASTLTDILKAQDDEGAKRLSFDWMKGLITNVNELDVGAMGGLLNVEGLVAQERELRRVRGIKSYDTTDVVGNPITIDLFEKSDGTRELLLVTTSFVYKRSSSAWAKADEATKAFDQSMVTSDTITFGTAHSFGAVGDTVNLRFDVTSGTPPADLVDETVYTFTISSTTVLTKSTITTGATFAGTLTNLSAYAGDEDYRVSGVNYCDHWIFASYGDIVKKWNGTNLTNMDGLATALTSCYARAITAYKTHLILGGTIENSVQCPWRIRWSAIGLTGYDTWTGVGTGTIDLLDTNSVVLKFFHVMDRCFVFTNNSIWELVYVGSPNIFVPQLVVANVGTDAPSTIATITGVTGGPEACIYLGTDDVYLFDGRTNTPIGGDFIREYVFGANAIIDTTYKVRSVGKYIPQDKIYMLCIPTQGNTYPNLTLIYDLVSQSWWKVYYGIAIRCFGDFVSGGAYTWNDLSASYDSSPLVWDDTYAAASAPQIIIGSTTSDTYELDFGSYEVAGSDLTAYLITPDLMNSVETRWLQFDIELFGEDGATLYYSYDEGANWISLGTKTGVSNQYKLTSWYMNFTKEKVRFKLVLESTTSRIRKNQAYVTYRTV